MAFCSSVSKFNLSQILSMSEKDNKGMAPKSEIVCSKVLLLEVFHKLSFNLVFEY